MGGHDLASMLPDSLKLSLGHRVFETRNILAAFQVLLHASDTNIVNVSMLNHFHPNTESKYC